MDSSSSNGSVVHGDPAKQFPFYPPEYWMVSEEWTQTFQESKVDPNSQGRAIVQKVGTTRAIAVHPLAHHVAGLASGIKNYRIIYAITITKKMYEWWVGITTPQSANLKDLKGPEIIGGS